MSFTLHKPIKTRVQRSTLAVPGSNVSMFEKAMKSETDVIFLDLEDAVSPNDKEQARVNIIKALNEMPWKDHGKTMCVRINGLDTHWMYRDVVDVVEQAGHNLDTILIPKVGVPADVYMVQAMVAQIREAKKIENEIGLEALIETALGMANVEAIAAARNLEALHFGVADFAASRRSRTVVIGGLNPDYPGDQWHGAIDRMVTACRAYGLRAIDGPFGDFNAPDDYIKAALRGAVLGCEGKWAIHPSQIKLANDVFSPTETEVNRARRIIEALKEAAAQGKGAASLDGRLIDAASERMAMNVVTVADLIAAKGK